MPAGPTPAISPAFGTRQSSFTPSGIQNLRALAEAGQSEALPEERATAMLGQQQSGVPGEGAEGGIEGKAETVVHNALQMLSASQQV